MTVVPHLVADVGRRRRHGSIWAGALITSACVAAGSAVALSTMPAVPKPADVAKAYLEARYAADWSQAWALLCTPGRSFAGSYTAYAERSAYWDALLSLPADVAVAVGEVHSPPGPGEFPTVSVTLTSAEQNPNRQMTGELPVTVEDGQFRVCDGGLGLD